MATAAALMQLIDFGKGVRYVTETRHFVLPGSWLPLTLLMAIFFTKYGVGVTLAKHGELSELPGFIIGVSIAYDIFSGAFFGRMAKILSTHGGQALRKATA